MGFSRQCLELRALPPQDNTGLISKVDEQQQLISKFKKEQARLGAGDAVPQWVVSSLELQLEH